MDRFDSGQIELAPVGENVKDETSDLGCVKFGIKLANDLAFATVDACVRQVICGPRHAAILGDKIVHLAANGPAVHRREPRALNGALGGE